MPASLATSFTRSGISYVQIQRWGAAGTPSFAIYRLDKPNRAKHTFTYEAVKIVGEHYPSSNPAQADNAKYTSFSLNLCRRKVNDWLGIRTGRWTPDPHRRRGFPTNS